MTPRTSAIVAATALALVALLAPPPAAAQLPRDPVERARVIKEILEANARQLTLFDRSGKPLGQIGPRAMYNRPVLSPPAITSPGLSFRFSSTRSTAAS